MKDVLSFLPLDLLGALSLACVFSSMLALGAGVRPGRILARQFPLRPLLAALAIALIGVPLATLVLVRVLGLQSGALVGLLLMGISPGAPLALRKSRKAEGDLDFSLVLQVGVAVLSIAAVPLWIMALGALYARDAGLSVAILAKQVGVAQILPLACGALLARLAPRLAARSVRPLLLGSGVLLAVLGVVILLVFWARLAALPWAAVVASAALAATTLAAAYAACGPSRAMRRSAGIACAMRNPGTALLIASANGLPEDARVMVVCHVVVTALAVALYVALLRGGPAEPATAASA
ncbi:MAG: hypothetical protein U1E62_13680 [Alsobacter sp.]